MLLFLLLCLFVEQFRLRLLLRAIAEEHSAAEAFERVYGRSTEDLEKEWWARVEKPGK